METDPPADDTDTRPIETDTPPEPLVCDPDEAPRGPLLAVFGDQLAVVDVVTGAATPLGVTLSAADLIEVAVDPRDGAWYGLRRGGAAPVLARLDLCTGLVTDVGTLLVAGRAVSSAEGFTIRGDGSAVVSVSLNGADFLAETLADLNLATGALSNTRTIQSFQDDVDEMFTDGAVWGSDSYVCGAGWCTEIGRVDNAGALQVIDTLSLHVTTFAFSGQASVIYAYNHDFGPALESLYRIDPATAAATPIGPIDPAGAFAAGPADLFWADLCCPIESTGDSAPPPHTGETDESDVPLHTDETGETDETVVVHTDETDETLVVHTDETGETLVVHTDETGETVVVHTDETDETLVVHTDETDETLVEDTGGEEVPLVCATDTQQHGPLLAIFGDQLVEVDPITGASTPTGVTLSQPDLYEIATDPATGVHYALRRFASPMLARVDLCTGAVTDVRALTTAGVVSAAEGFTIDMNGRAVVSVSLNGVDSLSETLADVDLATGALSNLRPIDSATDDVDEMFTDGAVWGADSYVCGGGWCTEVGPLSATGGLTNAGTYPLHLTTLTFDSDALMIYAYNLDEGLAQDSLYRIDPTTWAATPVGPIDPTNRFAAGPSELFWLPDLCCPVDDTGEAPVDTDTGDTDTGEAPVDTDTGDLTGDTDTGEIPVDTDTGDLTGDTDTGEIPVDTDTGDLTVDTDTGDLTVDTDTGALATCPDGAPPAGPLYAVFGDQLAEVDLTTGEATPLGVTLSVSDVIEVAMDVDGALYALRTGTAGPVLAMIDACTGEVTDVAPLTTTWPILFAEGFTLRADGSAVVSLSLDADTSSEMFGDLNLGTGVVGNLRAVSSAQNDLDELFSDGAAWGSDSYRCPTAWCTDAGPVDANGALQLGANFTWNLHLTTFAFRDVGGEIFAYNHDEGLFPEHLYRIDAGTGAATPLGPIDPQGLFPNPPADLFWGLELCCPVEDTAVLEVCEGDAVPRGPLLGVFGTQVAEVDPGTGAAGAGIATLAAGDITELAVHPLDGTVYGLRRGTVTPLLVEVDLCRGDVVEVGPISAPGRTVFAAEGMTFRADGTLVLAVSLNAADFLSETLAVVDLATGGLSGLVNISSFQNDVDEMFTDGISWGADAYNTCAGGTWCTQVGPVDAAGALNAIATYPLHLTTLTFNGAGSTIFAYNHQQGAFQEHLYRLDPVTTTATPIGPIDPANLHASAPGDLIWVPDLCCPPLP